MTRILILLIAGATLYAQTNTGGGGSGPAPGATTANAVQFAATASTFGCSALITTTSTNPAITHRTFVIGGSAANSGDSVMLMNGTYSYSGAPFSWIGLDTSPTISSTFSNGLGTVRAIHSGPILSGANSPQTFSGVYVEPTVTGSAVVPHFLAVVARSFGNYTGAGGATAQDVYYADGAINSGTGNVTDAIAFDNFGFSVAANTVTRMTGFRHTFANVTAGTNVISHQLGFAVPTLPTGVSAGSSSTIGYFFGGQTPAVPCQLVAAVCLDAQATPDTAPFFSYNKMYQGTVSVPVTMVRNAAFDSNLSVYSKINTNNNTAPTTGALFSFLVNSNSGTEANAAGVTTQINNAVGGATETVMVGHQIEIGLGSGAATNLRGEWIRIADNIANCGAIQTCNFGIFGAVTNLDGVFVNVPVDQGTGTVVTTAAFHVGNISSTAINTGTKYAFLSDDTTASIKVASLKSLTGTRFVCVDTTGKFSASATACSGT